MKLKIPPVAVFLIAAALLWAAVWLLPGLRLFLPGRTVLAILLALAGLLPGVKAVMEFAGRKTTVNPMAPETASALVTNGIYRISRNPMYLGLLLLLLALAVYWGTPVALLIVPGFVWYMTEFQIKPEETSLRKLFGAEYEAYLGKVRRWI
ncbi:methyltransferase family protein [Roseibium sp. M-1]